MEEDEVQMVLEVTLIYVKKKRAMSKNRPLSYITKDISELPV